MLQTNCYIIGDEISKTAAVIDPGGDCDEIMKLVNMYGYNVEYIIITHSHCDHIAALDELKDITNAKVVISTTDSATLNNNEYTLSFVFGESAPKTCPDIKVNDGDVLNIAGNKAKFIMTPGHTPGSMCIYFESEKLLFSGDTLFYESIGRTDFPGGSYASIANSIKNKLYPLGDNVKVYPGHNSDTTILHEKESNFYI
jgi:glyoxylase-like metal-dependent hydrolase (beta-lactamase superfamily II)